MAAVSGFASFLASSATRSTRSATPTKGTMMRSSSRFATGVITRSAPPNPLTGRGGVRCARASAAARSRSRGSAGPPGTSRTHARPPRPPRRDPVDGRIPHLGLFEHPDLAMLAVGQEAPLLMCVESSCVLPVHDRVVRDASRSAASVAVRQRVSSSELSDAEGEMVTLSQYCIRGSLSHTIRLRDRSADVVRRIGRNRDQGAEITTHRVTSN